MKAIDIWKAKLLEDTNRTELWKKKDGDLHKFIRESIPEALDHTGGICLRYVNVFPVLPDYYIAAAFDDHLVGVQLVLRIFGAEEELCLAGLFHSIYGTEGFQGYKFPITRRPEIRSLIGPRAERLVWIFCVVDRKTFDAALSIDKIDDIVLLAREELGRFPIPMNGSGEWLDLVELTLADWCEQVEGASQKPNHNYGWEIGDAWSLRRDAFRSCRDVLVAHRGERGFVMAQLYDEVFAREPLETRRFVQAVTPPMSTAAREARDALLSISL